MITLDSAVITQAQARVIGALHLVEAHFAQGVQRWTNWPLNLTWGGNTFLGLGTLGNVSEARESDSGTGEKVTLTLSPVPPEILTLALGGVENYRGRPINVYTWAVGSTYQPIGNPVLRHTLVMEQVGIKREKESGAIELTCMPAGANGTRRALGLRISHAQHRRQYPTERGLEYALGLVNQPQLWLSKAFQEI